MYGASNELKISADLFPSASQREVGAAARGTKRHRYAVVAVAPAQETRISDLQIRRATLRRTVQPHKSLGGRPCRI
jgi:hypothetical protein